MSQESEKQPLKKILIVDDTEIYRELLRDILSDGRFELDEAGDGVEALEKIENSNYDLIITDILMPNMSGIEMVVKMLEKQIKIKVIAISGGATDLEPHSFLYACKSLGVSGTLTKPFKPSEMLALIDEVLN